MAQRCVQVVERFLSKLYSNIFEKSGERRITVPSPLYPDDIFLVSYPKSGSTWVRFILTHLILSESDDPVDFATVQEVTPDIHMVGSYGISLNVQRPRVIKSHAAFTPHYPKVVYLVRDGRDVAVSFYYHQKKMSGYHGTFRDFIEAGCNHRPAWSEHVNSWLYQDHKIPLLCIRYEDLLANGPDQIRKLCSFCGIDATDDKITRALRLSEFNRLKRLEQEEGLGYVNQGDTNYRFIRKGEKGDWESHFDAESKEVFKRRHQTTLERLGYTDGSDW